jgi:hypothetical protein
MPRFLQRPSNPLGSAFKGPQIFCTDQHCNKFGQAGHTGGPRHEVGLSGRASGSGRDAHGPPTLTSPGDTLRFCQSSQARLVNLSCTSTANFGLLSARVSKIITMTDEGDSPVEGTAGEEPQQPAAARSSRKPPGMSVTAALNASGKFSIGCDVREQPSWRLIDS